MKSPILALLVGLLALSANGAESLKLEVMTFNLRYASERPPNAWTDRRPVVAEVFRLHQPDIVGTQEGVWQQIKDIDQDQSDYDWVGLGRQGGSRGEFCAIFYRTDKFELIAFDHFWLSDTPPTSSENASPNLNRNYRSSCSETSTVSPETAYPLPR